MSNIQICLNAVLPLFIYIVIGVIIKRAGMLNDSEGKRVNQILFTFFYPALMFDNIYSADLSALFDIRLMVFALIFIAASVIATTVAVCRIERNSTSRGAMIQAIYRSNFVLMGILIVGNIFGDEGIPTATMMATYVVPFFNFIAVIVLEHFRGGHANIGTVALNVIKNPLILGALAGVAVSLAGISLPTIALDVIGGLSDAAMPMALIILGVSFDPAAIRGKRRDILICLAGRLVIVPLIGLPIAAILGFRGPAFVSLIVMMASPTAVSSYPMAVAMDSDKDIAGSAVMISTPLSCITLFLWLLLFKNLGIY